MHFSGQVRTFERSNTVNYDTGLRRENENKEVVALPWLPIQGSLCNRIFEIFDNPSASFFSKYISFFIIILIIISSVAFVLETLPQYRYPEYGEDEFDSPPIFEVIESFCVIIFTIEYFIRILCIPWLKYVNNEVVKINIGTDGLELDLNDRDVWVGATITKINSEEGGEETYDVDFQDPDKDNITFEDYLACPEQYVSKANVVRGPIKNCCTQGQRTWKFFWDPLNVIDFLAIIPYYFGMIFGNGIGSELTILRILRLLRVLRLFKLAKYVEYIKVYLDVVIKASSSFVIVFIFIGMSSVLTSALVFFCEKGEWDEEKENFMRWDYKHEFREPTPFKSILHTMWWAIVTFTTTGYGDYYPTSAWGRVLGAATMMLGVIGLAMPISAINQVFHEVMEKHKNKKRSYIDATIEDRLQRGYKLVRKLNSVAEEVKWLHLAEMELTDEEYFSSLDLWQESSETDFDESGRLFETDLVIQIDGAAGESELHDPSIHNYTNNPYMSNNTPQNTPARSPPEQHNNNNNHSNNNHSNKQNKKNSHHNSNRNSVSRTSSAIIHRFSHNNITIESLQDVRDQSNHPDKNIHTNRHPNTKPPSVQFNNLDHNHHTPFSSPAPYQTIELVDIHTTTPHHQNHHRPPSYHSLNQYPHTSTEEEANRSSTIHTERQDTCTYESDFESLQQQQQKQPHPRLRIYDDEDETSQNQLTISDLREDNETSDAYSEDREISFATIPSKMRRENTREKLRNLPVMINTPNHMTNFV